MRHVDAVMAHVGKKQNRQRFIFKTVHYRRLPTTTFVSRAAGAGGNIITVSVLTQILHIMKRIVGDYYE